MTPLVENPGREAEVASFGLGTAMVALAIFSVFYLYPLDKIEFLMIAGFAVATAMTLLSAVNYRQKRLAKVHELERLEQTIREVVQSNG